MYPFNQAAISLRSVLVVAALTGILAFEVRENHSDLGLNERPVIGVLTQEFTGKPWDQVPYIAASYVKFVEGGGARVVPVHINRNHSYYRGLLDQLNGVIFPGGDADVHASGYGRAGKIIYDYAKERNNAGDYFPLWGTCLGFEMLVYLSVNSYILKQCSSMNQARPLQFSKDAERSRLLGSNLPTDVLDYLVNANTTANFHEWCLTPQNFTERGVNKVFNLLSVNKDSDGLTFISTLEAKDYPFYAVQFHPEKNIYEWTDKPGHNRIPHIPEAIRVGQYFAGK